MSTDSEEYLKAIARDVFEIRKLLEQLANATAEAESEMPEKMRRFVMYMHDVHDIVNIYEERGHPAPDYVKREMERCDDRYRHLLEDAHEAGGAFDKIRRDMAQRPGNRWDHTKLLPKGTPDETGNG